ncbi:MAG TPA: hypothetical protein VNX25_10120 [Verrucomicrobiae bacterium]|nr:hypothetical protein [Verrucomicrobiae bacterium]
MTASENSDAQRLSSPDLLDQSFLENRARLLDIAAFLDRLDRYSPTGDHLPDHRYRSLLQGLRLLADGEGDRARRLLTLLADATAEPLPQGAGIPPVSGAWRGER